VPVATNIANVPDEYIIYVSHAWYQLQQLIPQVKTVTEQLAAYTCTALCIFTYWKSVSIPVLMKSKELVASVMPFLAATVHQLATRQQLNS